MISKKLLLPFMILFTLNAVAAPKSTSKLESPKEKKKDRKFTIELELEYEVPERDSKREDNLEVSLSPGYYFTPNYLVLLDFEFEQNQKRDKKLELNQLEVRQLYFKKTKYFNFNFELGVGLPHQEYKYTVNPLIRTTFRKSLFNIKPFHRLALRKFYYNQEYKFQTKLSMENQLGLIYFFNKKLSFGVAQSFFYRWNQENKRTIGAAFDQSIVYDFSDLVKIEIGHEYYRPWRYKNGERTPFKLHSKTDSEYYMELQIRY